MKKGIKTSAVLMSLAVSTFLCSSAAQAQAQGRSVALPPQASEIAHGIYDLGQAVDEHGQVVQGYAFVHYKKEFAKREAAGKPAKADRCYSYMWAGASWGTLEEYVVDATEHNAGILLDLMEFGIAEWETAAGQQILGPATVGTVSPDQLGTYNNKNEVMFGSFAEEGVIAMTIVWRSITRQLVEWDMVFGDGWNWSYGYPGDENCPPRRMDFLNIATHELGHAMGMGHPSASCVEETMYAYADYQETKKRTLNAGDIAGIAKLYPLR